MSLPSRGVVTRVFVRSFLIQGSWNYRTMIGTGMAFTLLPVLRRRHRDPQALEGALTRHAERFNAHPYFAGLALGSLTRLEYEDTPEEPMRRFRAAVGGPLGGLGDRVVWATWLPLVALTALVARSLGASAAWTVGLFLIGYNVGHLLLRVWAFRTGLREGRSVAQRLTAARLARRAQLAEAPMLLLAGVLTGLLLVSPAGVGGSGTAWLVACVGAWGVGFGLGARVWRSAAAAVVLLVVGSLAVGAWVR